MKTPNLFSVTPLLMIALAALFCHSAKAAPAGRTVLSLDGQWQIADSKSPDEIPGSFTHTVPVPGLAHLATPPFPDMDRFISRERVNWLIGQHRVDPYWMVKYWDGKVEQDRNYFWYRKTFRAPSARAMAMLMIDKAQFGTAVWLNGQRLDPEDDAWHSEYPGGFSASLWKLSRAIRWNAENTLIVRIGAHPAVRGLDLSHRPWEDSYNPPGSPGDVEEFHGYFFDQGAEGKLTFKMSDLEKMDGAPIAVGLDTPVPSTRNAVVLNEYGSLWLNRDGSTKGMEYSENVYSQLVGVNATNRERLDEWAYLLAGLTEYWRAHRQMAAVDYFVYLTDDIPDVATSDDWSDVKELKLDPAFADYAGEAFKPLGVYINFFHPTLRAGAPHEFLVKMINDYDRPMAGELILTLETKEGKTLSKAEKPFDLAALGAGDFPIMLPAPGTPQDSLILKATAVPDQKSGVGPTISRRWLSVTQ